MLQGDVVPDHEIAGAPAVLQHAGGMVEVVEHLGQKVAPVRQMEDRVLALGPVYARARALYWDFAHSRFERAEAV